MSYIEVLKWRKGENLRNFSRDEIFEAIQVIDHAVFHENGTATKHSDEERYEAFKDGYIFAIHDNRIIGYFNWFPITENFHNSVTAYARVFDGDIKSRWICDLKEKENYIFLLSAAILPEYQHQGISKQFSAIIMQEFSEIDIKDIVSYAYTIGGEHLLNVFGLKKFSDMGDGIKLMRLAKYMEPDGTRKTLNIPIYTAIGKRFLEMEVVKWQELINFKNYSREDIFSSIQEINNSLCDIERYEAYKESFVFILYKDKIIGYLCYFPITEEFYNFVIEGTKVYDSNITSTYICSLKEKDNYIFMVPVAIHVKRNEDIISYQLLRLLIDQLSKIKIKDIVSYASRDNEKSFLKSLGLDYFKIVAEERAQYIKLMRLASSMVEDGK